ncbi:putative Mg2+ transporter-C (MgtC) family protein [Marinitoga hydrogenitolerans DSM 16785]|uniref:Mg2+ transporter-C (MgtC) family protein n=1 Tax=Marinitoga hydrogenitolerans (strain DSM 16785 / JCM 12826 / AT1271) TaxID=1122195 RepID=A0A1M4XR70_MARH1|nr:MgtC/SapB family protein [Marinitoga hydrogenitolerans]SHE95866.1 putative Mg2+ transporter-C (MgtC) family protein [Marinitoga hydrogenitolerans DSM 16785]
MTYYEIIIKIILSSISGALIGYNREKINRPAGIRTHALLSLGASILTIISITSFYDPVTKVGDPGRIAAQIVSGIGFLGAGTILKNGNKVKGLTTAATLWVSASIGMTFGAGAYFVGISALIITLIILYINKFSKHLNIERTIEITLKDKKDIKKILDIFSKHNNIILKNIDFSQKDDGILYFVLEKPGYMEISKIQKELMYIENIENINIIDDN